MERSPSGRHSRLPPPRAAGRLAAAMGVAAALALVLPSSVSGAALASPSPSLKTLLARVNKISLEISTLSEQYDALRIQLAEAKTQLKIAQVNLRADQRLLAVDEAAIGQIAAAGYMFGGINPSLQLLQSSDPQQILSRASILSQLQRENGDKISTVAAARATAQRASLNAIEEQRQAAKLASAMKAKVAKIQAKENILNSAIYAKALQQYEKTGSYPPVAVTGNSIEVQALRKAMTRIGSAYVWGAAGPSTFDCSGLVVWAYAQVGITLPHYTGYLWNSGVHVSRSQLRPGDLVFFFPDIGHVGIYVGGGTMLDAPTYGIPVGIHSIFWGAYVGAVRIA